MARPFGERRRRKPTTTPVATPTALGLLATFLGLRVVPQMPELQRLTLGWALASALGAWLGAAVTDELRHGWHPERFAACVALLVGVTLATNYAHSQRR